MTTLQKALVGYAVAMVALVATFAVVGFDTDARPASDSEVVASADRHVAKLTATPEHSDVDTCLRAGFTMQYCGHYNRERISVAATARASE